MLLMKILIPTYFLIEDKINNKVFVLPAADSSVNGIEDYEAQLREVTLNEISDPFFNNISVTRPYNKNNFYAVDNGILYFLSDDKIFTV